MRRIFKRDLGVPDDAVARLELPRGERVLAAARADGGTWLVGTRAAFYVVPDSDPVVRLPWQQVESADWSRDDDRLRVLGVGEFGRSRPTFEFTLGEPGPLLALVRERVMASLVLQRRVELSGSVGLLVVARRAPTGGDEITWSYEYDAGVDPADPDVRRKAEEGLRQAAEELGLR